MSVFTTDVVFKGVKLRFQKLLIYIKNIKNSMFMKTPTFKGVGTVWPNDNGFRKSQEPFTASGENFQ